MIICCHRQIFNKLESFEQSLLEHHKIMQVKWTSTKEVCCGMMANTAGIPKPVIICCIIRENHKDFMDFKCELSKVSIISLCNDTCSPLL